MLLGAGGSSTLGVSGRGSAAAAGEVSVAEGVTCNDLGATDGQWWAWW